VSARVRSDDDPLVEGDDLLERTTIDPIDPIDPMVAAIDRALHSAPPIGGALTVADHVDVLLDLRNVAEDLALLATVVDLVEPRRPTGRG
jgi:hypothetical protein